MGTNTIRPSTAHRLTALLAALLALVSQPLPAEPARYQIDPEHLSVGFLVDHIGYAKVLGMFRKATGAFTFDEQSGRLSDVAIEIDTASVFTNHRKRDGHLKSGDFLNSKEFPTMRFTAREAMPDSDRRYRIAGELELLGVRKPVVLEARWNKSGQYPFGHKAHVVGVSARGSFKRSDFGMLYSVDNGWVGDEVELMIELEAIRQ